VLRIGEKTARTIRGRCRRDSSHSEVSFLRDNGPAERDMSCGNRTKKKKKRAWEGPIGLASVQGTSGGTESVRPRPKESETNCVPLFAGASRSRDSAERRGCGAISSPELMYLPGSEQGGKANCRILKQISIFCVFGGGKARENGWTGSNYLRGMDEDM